MNKSKVINFIRKSTPGQTTKVQKEYHCGKKTVTLTGSAWKRDKNPVFKFLKNEFKKNKTIIANFFTADRFSRNTRDCDDLKFWLTQNNKKLIIIANRKRYDFVEDYREFINLIEAPEAQSYALSVKSKKMHEEMKKHPRAKKEIILNEVEKYFVSQIIFTKDENNNYLSINDIFTKMKGCGIVNFSKDNIKKWREEIEEPNSLYCRRCRETDLFFAHPEGEHEADDDIPLWHKYKRFVLFPEFAVNLAQNYPYLNAIWEEDNAPENTDIIEEMLEDLSMDDEETSSDEDYDPEEEINHETSINSNTLDTIKEAHIMLNNGIISYDEFIKIKEKLLN